MKTFVCNLSNFHLKKQVKIDTSQCRTGEDFKKKVASELELKEHQFKIDNPPTKEQINSKIDKIDLNITFTNLSDKIVFKLPNSKQILIRIDTYSNKKQLIDLFKIKEIYFHERTIEFLHFHLCGVLLQPGFIFSVAPEGSIVHITATKNLITIKLHDYQFIFFEGQRCVEASTLIYNFLKKPEIFEIQNSITHETISDADFLSNKIQYYVHNRKIIQFCHISSPDCIVNSIDVLTTIAELKGLLANIFSEKNKVKPTGVFIYDKDKVEITDSDANLLCFPKEFNKFYFDYEIKVDDKNQKKEKNNKDDKRKKKPEVQQNKKYDDSKHEFQQNKKVCWWINFEFKSKPELNFIEYLPNDTKMSQISSLIAKKCRIKDDIELSYKENTKFIKIDDDKSIFDVKSHIRINGKNGFHNYLFVDIKSKKAVDDDDDDEDAQQYQLKERRDARDVQNKKQKNDNDYLQKKNKNKQKTKIYHKDDDDDDDNEDDSSSSQKVQKPKKIERKDKNDKRRSKSKESNDLPKIQKHSDGDGDDESSESSSKQILTVDDDDNDNDSDDLPNKRQKGRNEDKFHKKKIQEDDHKDDKNEQKKNSLESYKSKYSFQYGDFNKKINLRNDFHLKENEKFIKLFLKIDEEETLDYFIINDKNKEEEVDAENVVMQSLKDKIIIVKIHKNLKANLVDAKKESSHKYFYQINSESKINEIVLDSSATVLSLKEAIAEKNDVDDIVNIKVLFAGKDLLNSIVLESLELGSDILYVYIRSMEDILLMTAKALKV